MQIPRKVDLTECPFSPLLCICILHLDPNPTICIDRWVRLDPDLLDRLPTIRSRPCHWRLSFRVRVHVQRDRLERLRNPGYDSGSLVISDLLAGTDTGAGVEGEEDEGVRNEVCLDPIIEEAVRVEIERCELASGISLARWPLVQDKHTSGPPKVGPSLHQPRRIVDLRVWWDVNWFSPIKRWPQPALL